MIGGRATPEGTKRRAGGRPGYRPLGPTELTVSILLWSAGNETIGVAVYNLQDHGNGLGAASLALLVMGLVGVGNWAAGLAAGAGRRRAELGARP